VSFGLRLTGTRQLQSRLEALGNTKQHLGRIGLEGVAEAKARVPRRTGNLARTIRLGRVTETSVEVTAGGRNKVGYAAAVEYGSRAHVIRPRKAKVLAWGGVRTLGGRLRKGAHATNFARRVRHPGTRAKPYLVPGVMAAVRRVGSGLLVKAWNSGA